MIRKYCVIDIITVLVSLLIVNSNLIETYLNNVANEGSISIIIVKSSIIIAVVLLSHSLTIKNDD